jgi:hypothetical protein
MCERSARWRRARRRSADDVSLCGAGTPPRDRLRLCLDQPEDRHVGRRLLGVNQGLRLRDPSEAVRVGLASERAQLPQGAHSVAPLLAGST